MIDRLALLLFSLDKIAGVPFYLKKGTKTAYDRRGFMFNLSFVSSSRNKAKTIDLCRLKSYYINN
jgi:hypothetical protein